jgi:hypothetical protein
VKLNLNLYACTRLHVEKGTSTLLPGKNQSTLIAEHFNKLFELNYSTIDWVSRRVEAAGVESDHLITKSFTKLVQSRFIPKTNNELSSHSCNDVLSKIMQYSTLVQRHVTLFRYCHLFHTD